MEKSKNNTAKTLIIIFVVIISVGVLSIGGLYVWLHYDIFPRHKLGGVIPVGVYAPYEDGEVKDYALEYNWSVFESEIEYLYATYEFVEEYDKMYFKSTSREERFEVKYDEETKVLSIYLPENILNGWEKHSEIREWKTFKRK